MEALLQRVSAFIDNTGRRNAENTQNINFEKRTNFWYLIKKTNFAGVVYVLGALCVAIGLMAILEQNWNDINSTARIAIILIVGINCYLIGTVLCHFKIMDSLGQALWFLSAWIFYLGFYFEFIANDVLDNVIGTTGSNLTVLSGGISVYGETLVYITLPLFIVYLASFFVFRRNVLLVLAVLFGLDLFGSIVGVIASDDYVTLFSEVFGYQALIIGCIYLLLGWLFSNNEKRYLLTWPFYFLGAVSVLMGGYILIEPNSWTGSNGVWEVLYPFLVIGIFSLVFVLRKVWFVIAGLVGALLYIAHIFQDNDLPFSYLAIGIAMLIAAPTYLYAKRRRTPPTQT